MRERGIIRAAAVILAVGGAVGANARSGEWIDLLSVATRRSTSFGGSWQTTEKQILAKSTGGGRLEIPLAVSGSYELAATLSRVDGEGPFGIRFPVGLRSLALGLSAAKGRPDLLDGTWRSEGGGKTSATPAALAPLTKRDVRIKVLLRGRLAKVTVTVDGKEHLSWQGNTRKICPEELWGDTRAKTLSLGLWGGSMRVSALKLRVTDGKRRLLKSRPAPKLARFDPKNLPKVQGVGRPDGTPFREAVEKDGLLAGFCVRYSTKGGLLTLIPIFRTKDGIVYGQRRGGRQYPDELAQTLLARDGFAVGGVIATRGTQRPIAAIKAVFMKVTDGKLDRGKSYESPPCGAPSDDRAVLLGGDGRAVIGIEGRSGSTIEQLSLVLR